MRSAPNVSAGETSQILANTPSASSTCFAGLDCETAIGCHTFRATGITDYLTNGGRIEVAQRMAGHSNAKTTGLYDDISVGEVERIGI